ncbi:hypothetical protein A2716_01155 [candidate division WWE3 bacterium RIFCSPHIGHO2_01_FULL_40_23]|uniref:histidine kinase n=1 Tax=candidate division WWE3 bacterium RIFCSPLOWO2_01_FULL_41_18 TaxID=1802625 RepID=A0A1F4VDY1_UNCKA|nr:MAG: hypothetical protein A2716_01155 [candidate division WWE3 bacterium RIFCSPHIGHO2_01_FULL_40_23]OGC55345.1 MAG: hypothetical protein A3A78_00060 [candidate division WWE3 bacterium RIFCSPLOWO2_01_FULL_41_18]
MKNISIKLQLTIWYTLTIFIICFVLFISFFYITKKSLISETDRSLLHHASEVAYNIGLNTNTVFDSQTQEILDVSKAQIPGILITVTDIVGHDIKNQEDGTFQNLASISLKENKEVFINQSVNGSNLRLIAYPIKRGETVIGTIVMGHPVDIFQNALNQLRNLAFLLILFLILPSILFGYLLASNATYPLLNLSKKMQRITTENLSERVEIPSKSSETFQLVESFNNLLNTINESFNREKEFIGEAAHEIKTPLTIIKSNAEVTLSKERTQKEYEASLTQVLTYTEELSKSVSGLIDLAWSRTKDIQKHFKRVNLSFALKEVCDNARYLCENKGLSLKCSIEDDLFVTGKEEKLSQVFYNLLDNAVKYTTEGGNIIIELSKKGDLAVVKVFDSGVGIDKKELETIFDRFYRSEGNKNIKGHGLGLSIASSIIKAHNGTIEAESERNKGTIFTVTLPLSS